MKPEELTAWILAGLAANGRASPVSLNAGLSNFLTDFELSDTEREEVKTLVLESSNGNKRNRKRNRSK